MPFLEPITEETQSDLHSTTSRGTSTLASGTASGSSASRGRGGGGGSALRPPSRALGGGASGGAGGGDENDLPEGIRNNGLKKWWHVMGSSSRPSSLSRHAHGPNGATRGGSGGDGGRREGISGSFRSATSTDGRGSDSGRSDGGRGSDSGRSDGGNSSILAVDMGDDGNESGAHQPLNLLPPVNSMEGEADEEEMLSLGSLSGSGSPPSFDRNRSGESDYSGGGVELDGMAAGGVGEAGGGGPDFAAGGSRKVSFANTVQVATTPPRGGGVLSSSGGGGGGGGGGMSASTALRSSSSPPSNSKSTSKSFLRTPGRKKKHMRHSHAQAHHHLSQADGAATAATVVTDAAIASGGGAGIDDSNRRKSIRSRRCSRSQLLMGFVLLAALLAIAIGLSVHFVGNSRDNASSAATSAEDVFSVNDEDDAFVTEAPTIELTIEAIGDEADIGDEPAVGEVDETEANNDRDDPDKGGAGGGSEERPPPDDGEALVPTPQRQPDGPVPTSAPTVDAYREDYIAAAEDLLASVSAITSDGTDGTTVTTNPIEDEGTPQYKAYDWITNWDEANLQLDVGQPRRGDDKEVVTDRRYRQRYVLGVLYYSLGGNKVESDRRLMTRARRRMRADTIQMNDGDDRRVRQGDGGSYVQRSEVVNGRQKVKERLLQQEDGGRLGRQRRRRLQSVIEEPTQEPTLQPTTESTDEPTVSASPVAVSAVDPFDNYLKSSVDDESFLSPRHECRWHGISCETRSIVDSLTGKVTGESEEVVVAIDLSAMGLVGSIPEEIGSIDSLEDLTLYNNDISGTVPISLTNLKDLYFVDIGNNWLTGSVPLFGESLTFLYLNANRLSGRHPRGRSGINYQLKHMWLQQNKLSGTLSDRISNFPNLEQLILYDNNFSGTLPTSLSSLSKLSYLDLSSNSFTGTLPETFYDTTSLVNVYLSNNQFSGPIVSAVSNLIKLEFLWVDSNQLVGGIRPSMGSLLNLRSMLLQENMFKGEIPDEVCGLFSGASDGAQGELERLEADCGGDVPVINCTCCTKCWPE